MVPWATRVNIPDSTTIGSAVFAGITVVTDRQTDRPRYSICSNRLHLASAAMWPNNNNKQKYQDTQNTKKHKKITQKTKARFNCLLRHQARKLRGPILISALHKFVTYLLTYTLAHLLTASGSTQGFYVSRQTW